MDTASLLPMLAVLGNAGNQITETSGGKAQGMDMTQLMQLLKLLQQQQNSAGQPANSNPQSINPYISLTGAGH